AARVRGLFLFNVGRLVKQADVGVRHDGAGRIGDCALQGSSERLGVCLRQDQQARKNKDHSHEKIAAALEHCFTPFWLNWQAVVSATEACATHDESTTFRKSAWRSGCGNLGFAAKCFRADGTLSCTLAATTTASRDRRSTHFLLLVAEGEQEQMRSQD